MESQFSFWIIYPLWSHSQRRASTILLLLSWPAEWRFPSQAKTRMNKREKKEENWRMEDNIRSHWKWTNNNIIPCESCECEFFYFLSELSKLKCELIPPTATALATEKSFRRRIDQKRKKEKKCSKCIKLNQSNFERNGPWTRCCFFPSFVGHSSTVASNLISLRIAVQMHGAPKSDRTYEDTPTMDTSVRAYHFVSAEQMRVWSCAMRFTL